MNVDWCRVGNRMGYNVRQYGSRYEVSADDMTATTVANTVTLRQRH